MLTCSLAFSPVRKLCRRPNSNPFQTFRLEINKYYIKVYILFRILRFPKTFIDLERHQCPFLYQLKIKFVTEGQKTLNFNSLQILYNFSMFHAFLVLLQVRLCTCNKSFRATAGNMINQCISNRNSL